MNHELLGLYPRQSSRRDALCRRNQQLDSPRVRASRGHGSWVHKAIWREDVSLLRKHATAEAAIQREKNIKHWSREWKIDLIVSMNPEWRDLYDDIVQ
jgi:hypothetical protein